MQVARRDALRIAALAAAAAAIPPKHANALSKKRMLAKAGPVVALDSGISYREVTVGSGIQPQTGDTVAIHYSLFYDNFEVESSRESQGLAASPIGFTYNANAGPGAVLPGINLGLDGMRVGGLRFVTVPPQFAYGKRGKEPFVPPNATVEFAIQLLSVKRNGTPANLSVGSKTSKY